MPGVTLIGDATHLAPPNGDGANLAMYDGAELGKPLAALTEYEQAMFPRSAAATTSERGEIPGTDSEYSTAQGLISMITEKSQ